MEEKDMIEECINGILEQVSTPEAVLNGAAVLIIVYDGEENCNHYNAVQGCGEDIIAMISHALIKTLALLPVVRLAADYAESKLENKNN